MSLRFFHTSKLLAVILFSVLVSGCSSVMRPPNMDALSPRSTYAGVVQDHGSSTPLGQATVTLSYVGWGERDGSIVWDKETVTEITTAADGSFAVVLPVDKGVFVRVIKDGYASYEGWHGAGEPIMVRLQRDGVPPSQLRKDTLQIGFEQGSAYGWNFGGTFSTANEAEADLWPIKSDSAGTLTLQAPGEGGIVRVTAAELGVNHDVLTYSDWAPETGYQKTISLDLTQLSGNSDVYFVRTRDGKHYAKFEFDPSSIGLIGSGQPSSHETWGVILSYVYNPDGTRNLTYRRK